MGTTTVTATNKKKALIAYQCSNCGKVHLMWFDVVSQGQALGMGMASKSRQEQMEEKAGLVAAESMTEFEKELSENNFEHKQVPSHPCENCGHIESWMSLEQQKNKELRLIMGVSTILWILLFIVAMILGVDHPSGIGELLLMGAVIMLVVEIITAIILKSVQKREAKRIQKAVQKSPQGSLPLISFDPLAFVDAVKTRFPGDLSAQQAAETIRKALETTE